MSFSTSLVLLSFFYSLLLGLRAAKSDTTCLPLALPNSIPSSSSSSSPLKDSPLSAPGAVYLRGGGMRRRAGPVCFVLAVNNGPQSVLMDYSNIWYPPVSLSLSLLLSLFLSSLLPVSPCLPFLLFSYVSLFRFLCLFLRSVSPSHPNMLGGLEAKFITHTDLFALAT